MTQKELLYFEDAIGHETNIVKICQDELSTLQDDSLRTFLESEIEKHHSLKKELVQLLEEKSNE